MAKSRIDFIIGELQRPSDINRPLLILMTSTHPMTDKNLCLTGHAVYNFDISNFPIKWHRKESVPNNMKIISSLDDLPHRPDVILSQNIVDQYNVWLNIARQFDCPIISFEHTLPTEEWLKFNIPQKISEDLKNTLRIFITEYSKNIWCPTNNNNCYTIYHMVDTDKYCGWQGGNGRAMILVNAFSSRKWAVGDVEAILTLDSGNKISLFGDNPGYESIPLNSEAVVKTMTEFDVFINTSLRSPLPASLLEAASVGMPIVTTNTCDIPKFFKDEENCLFFSSKEECLDKVNELLQNKDKAKKLGEEARKTVLSYFNKNRYVKDWNKILSFAIERHHEE